MSRPPTRHQTQGPRLATRDDDTWRACARCSIPLPPGQGALSSGAWFCEDGRECCLRYKRKQRSAAQRY